MSSKKRQQSVFSHVVVHDYGFAPNPYGGFLSIATCKPRIRSSAHVGDWVVGVGSVKTVGGESVVYAALVNEIVPIDVYGSEERFAIKRPVFRAEPWRQVGDSVYYRNDAAEWSRRPSLHNASHVKTDLSGKRVLLAQEFYYFGATAPLLPEVLTTLAKPGRGHRRFTDRDLIVNLANWLRSTFESGILGEPYHEVPRTRIVRA